MDQTRKAITYMVLASAAFAMMGLLVRELSRSMSSVEIVFFRNLIGLVILLPSFWRYPMRMPGGRPALLAFRGFIGFASLLLFFYALANMPLGNAMTLNKTAPIFTALFTLWFLSEKVSRKVWFALLIGFVGIIFMLKPSADVSTRLTIMGLLSGMGAGMAYSSIRQLREFYDTRIIVMSFLSFGAVGPLILMTIASGNTPAWLDFAISPYVWPSFRDWLLILVMGSLALVAQILMTRAYEISKAAVVGTASYSAIVFSFSMGVFTGDPFPGWVTLMGIFLIIISGILVVGPKKKQQ